MGGIALLRLLLVLLFVGVPAAGRGSLLESGAETTAVPMNMFQCAARQGVFHSSLHSDWLP
eukprot:COSAG02_NODE_4295_length_5539_cov_2.488235_1_plen_61_part_00